MESQRKTEKLISVLGLGVFLHRRCNCVLWRIVLINTESVFSEVPKYLVFEVCFVFFLNKFRRYQVQYSWLHPKLHLGFYTDTGDAK